MDAVIVPRLLIPNRLYAGDAVELLKALDDESIDLCITSPPYDDIRDYHGKPKVDFNRLGEELFRVLKDGSMVVMVIQDATHAGAKSLTSFSLAVDWCRRVGFRLWECCIYARRGTPGNWWTKRFRVDHEFILIFMKGQRPRYFNKDHMLIETMDTRSRVMTTRKTDGSLTEPKIVHANPKMCPGTIMFFNSASREGNGIGLDHKGHKIKLLHPATFGDKLARDFILAFSRPGWLVLDPFAGSGTVLRMAKATGRKYLGFDISPKYIALASRLLERQTILAEGR